MRAWRFAGEERLFSSGNEIFFRMTEREAKLIKKHIEDCFADGVLAECGFWLDLRNKIKKAIGS